MRTVLRWIILPLAVFAASCSVTRYTPQGSYVLMSNTVVADHGVPRKERITEENIDKYIQQSPANRLFGTNMGVWIYNSVPPDSRTWWARWMHSVGSAPVLLDTAAVRLSASYVTSYIRSRGYFNGAISYSVDTTRKRKASVTYTLKQGEPYRISHVKYDFRDRFLEPVIMETSALTLIKTGAAFDSGVLDQERRRIKDYLQNKGYYNFNVNNITYLADTNAGGRKVDITMVVHQYLAGYADDGTPQLDNNTVYRLSRINIYPDYDPTRGATDSTYLHHLDTLEYRGLNILYDGKLKIKKEMLAMTLGLYPNYLYSAADVTRAYNNLMRLGYYKSARIVFSDDTSQGRNFVTFIGENGSDEQTAEQYLNCDIFCTPSLSQGYNVGLETTFTSDYYGLSVTVGYRNRSLFKGVETFDISFTGSYDFMKVKGQNAAFEFGGTTSLTFPRFVLPFRLRVLGNARNPRSKVELSVNAQRKPYYHRILANASWGYSWMGNRYLSYSIRPLDIGAVKVNFLDSTYFNTLTNKLLKESYESQLLSGISGSFAYNNPNRNARGNSLGLRLNWETKGNLLYGISKMVGPPKNGDQYQLLGLPYTQYARIDAAVSNGIPIGNKVGVFYRFYAGAGITYGNSYGKPLPYDRQFYSGGANSMRGWAARTLGPGGTYVPDSTLRYPSQTGSMRLEANVEARFPIWSLLQGAVFFDLGNVWYFGGWDYVTDDSRFKFNTFYKQLGFNTGLGLRFDISMAVIRLDWGIRLHDPTKMHGEQWIHGFRFKNTALSLAVGYPF